MSESFVGLISDTHGLLRPEAIAALRGASLIVHAGDVGRQGILDELARIDVLPFGQSGRFGGIGMVLHGRG